MSIDVSTVDPTLKTNDTLRERVGCEFTFEGEWETPMILIVRAQPEYHHRVVDEYRVLEPDVPVEEYTDMFGNLVWRLIAPAGTLRVRYDALVDVPAAPDPVLPDLLKARVEEIPGPLLTYTLPSRYCQSDLFIGDAWDLFGHVQGGWAQVQAICDWIHENITYKKSSSVSTTTVREIYEQRAGVCRDFAHLGVTLCRALNIPARYVCGYLPEIGVEPDPTPMDFHAWFEAWIDGAWRTFDARHNIPRIGRVLIATGRDAVDTAFNTSYGSTRLAKMKVWADQVDADVRLERPHG
jgi:transglutaminase-like putative cysteine protease